MHKRRSVLTCLILTCSVAASFVGCSASDDADGTGALPSTGLPGAPPTSTPPPGSFSSINNFGSSPSQGFARATAVQSDGKILLGGYSDRGATYDFALIRYNTNGSLDSSFGTGGKVVTDIGDDMINAIAIQTDGKILVAGSSDPSGSVDFALLRYNTNGSLDTSFGTAGKVTSNFSDDSAYAIALQSDGKILVAGFSNVAGSYDFAVARYNTNGSADTSFGTGGRVTADIGVNSDDQADAIAVQSDGKIVVTGRYYNGGTLARDFAIVRLNTDGSLDNSFGTAGKVITDIGVGTDDTSKSIALQADGKILAIGYSRIGVSEDFTVVRYNTNGSLDTSFGTTGKVTTDIGTNTGDIAIASRIQTDGKIVLGGFSDSGVSYNFVVVRYNSNGSLDTSFGTTGIITTDLGSNTYDYANAMALQDDGKVVVVGQSGVGGASDFAAVRYNSNGSIDASFGSSGVTTTDIAKNGDDSASAIALLRGCLRISARSNIKFG